ncbi:MAG: hypothetical protein AAGK66_07815 [Pseudomonadota bacterium]
MRQNTRAMIFTTTALATALVASPASAQETGEDAEARQDTIIVSGEKIERSLQDTVSSVDVTTAPSMYKVETGVFEPPVTPWD